MSNDNFYENLIIQNLQDPIWQENCKQYDAMMAVVQGAELHELERLALSAPPFPHGVDPFHNRHWITNAIDYQALASIRWMLSKAVDVSFMDDEGQTALLSALEGKDAALRYEIMEELLKAGAPPNRLGHANETAAQRAAWSGDLEALKLLQQYGANLSQETEDLGSYSTPLSNARRQGHTHIVDYLVAFQCGQGNN
jgi:ankyrin repeat protein